MTNHWENYGGTARQYSSGPPKKRATFMYAKTRNTRSNMQRIRMLTATDANMSPFEESTAKGATSEDRCVLVGRATIFAMQDTRIPFD